MSAYSSSEKFLQICTALQVEKCCDQKRFQKNFDLTDCLDPGNARQYEIIRMFKNHNCGNVAKTMSGGFKLKSCTAADHKFLFRTSKCFRKLKTQIIVGFLDSKSRSTVKVGKHCSAVLRSKSERVVINIRNHCSVCKENGLAGKSAGKPVFSLR